VNNVRIYFYYFTTFTIVCLSLDPWCSRRRSCADFCWIPTNGISYQRLLIIIDWQLNFEIYVYAKLCCVLVYAQI